MTRDVHGDALARSRKRAALRAWDEAVKAWREAGCPRTDRVRYQPVECSQALRAFAVALRRVYRGLDMVCGPGAVAEGW